MMTAVIRAVLFDAVGTLIRPWPSVGGVYSRIAAGRGVTCPADVLQREFRAAYRELMPRRFRGGTAFRTSEAMERRWWKSAVRRTFERAGCIPLPESVVEGAFDAFASGEAWKLYADARPALQNLFSRGIKIGIVSNFDSRLRRVAGDLGLGDFAPGLTISSETGYAKPAPEIYRAALAAVGTKPGETLFVGDRPLQDHDGPRREGLNALWLVRNGRRRGRRIIRSLAAVPQYL